MTIPTPYLPDPDDVIRAIVESIGLHAQPNLDTEWLEKLPLIVARHRQGTSGPVHPKFAGKARWEVSSWSSDRREASNNARAISRAIYDAWRSQATFGGAHIGSYEEQQPPYELRVQNQRDNTYCFFAIYVPILRPS